MRRERVLAVIALMAVLAATLGLPGASAHADVRADYDIPNGHFFTQTNGGSAGDLTGYGVINDGDASFWTEFRRLGGLTYLGYPISRRFTWDGFVVQAFQKGILQWRRDARQASLVNVFDLLRDNGKDAWLQTVRATPPGLPPSRDDGKKWADVVRDHTALLEANAAFKKQYYSVPDPLTFFGLPSSKVVDNGTHYVIRLQRAVMQQWKVDVPWAKAGQVTIANGGEIAKEAGVLPADALEPDIPALGAGRVVAIDAGHGGAEIGAAYRFADGTIILEKELNLRVALKVADLISRAGYKAVLTRTTDTEVNKPPKLLTRRLPIGLDDELQARIDIANNAGAKLFLSIHFNGHPDSRLRGTEVYYCRERPFGGESRRFAEIILANLSKGLSSIGYRDNDAAVKDDSQALRTGEHFYLLGPVNDIITRASQMPAALGEALFVSNSTDATALRVDRTLEVIARAYATAIYQYFQATDPSPLPPPAPTPAPTPAPPPAPRTPPPAAAPTPPPPASLGQGTVATDGEAGAFLRSGPKTSATILRALADGTNVNLVLAVDGEAATGNDRRWYRVRVAGDEGFVYGGLIRTAANPAARPLPPKPIAKGTIATDFGGGAMLRAAPNTDADTIRSIPDGETIDLLESVSGQTLTPGINRWYRARYDGAAGFIYGELVQTGADLSPKPSSPAPIDKAAVATEFGGGAMLRAAPNTGADTIRSIPDGDTIDLVEAVSGEEVMPGSGRWYRARYGGDEGFVYGELVRR